MSEEIIFCTRWLGEQQYEWFWHEADALGQEVDARLITSDQAREIDGRNYDAAVLTKNEEGKVKVVDKTEKPTQHAAWALLRKRDRMRGQIAVDSHRYLALTFAGRLCARTY